MKRYLRKWLRDSNIKDFSLKSMLDWDYYKTRLEASIQKIITIPAALQKCENPCPRIAYPKWLSKKIAEQEARFKQKKLNFFLKPRDPNAPDIEDLARRTDPPKKLVVGQQAKAKEKQQAEVLNMDDCPRIEENFSEWLRYQKSEWRRFRREGVQQPAVEGSLRSAPTGAGRSG